MQPIAVSVEQAAEMIGISPTTMRSYIDRGRIPVVKLPSARHEGDASRRVLVAVSDLELFILKNRVTEAQR